jgi:4-hydroxyproline epimerase
MMSGSMIYPPSNPENDFGILFIETSGCLPMCGHATIGTVTVAIEEGLITPKIPGKLRMESPAGLITIEYQQKKGKVSSVKLINVGSYLAGESLYVEYGRLGKITFDLAYGGNFYAIVDPQENFSGLQNYSATQIVQWSIELRKLMNEKYQYAHPENPGISGISHILWTGNTIDPTSDGRSAVFYGSRALDRSPCGTGTSARMAQLVAKGKLKTGDRYVHESIIGSKFIGVVERATTIDSFTGIIPSIEGWAKITGYNNIIIDEADDPYAHGFQV